VVKAASGTGGGEGTTAGVDTPARLMRARLRAGRFGTRLLIERQAPGTVYRLLFLDGELIDVIRHLPPRLTGDGQRTVEQLIEAENERRLAADGAAGLSLLEVGLDTVFTLERQALRLDSVVADGAEVAVQTVTNDNRIEDTQTVREPLHPELIEAARRAAATVGLRLAGVDLISTDPSRPLEQNGGVVVEVNGTPGIHHHYHVADGANATRVAVPILDRVLTDHRQSEPSDRREHVAHEGL
jgi:cyanophycin synthetase